MEETVISVNNLSKRYRLGVQETKSDTLGGAIMNTISYPIRNFKRLRSLSSFNEQKEDESVLWALKDLSFNVKKGEVVGIIGKNGAGKSTLLKILSRITPPTEGEISIKGRVASLLEVGTGFHNELTGRENIYLNGTILGMTRSEIEKNFDEIVEFSGVGKFIDTPVKRYSSGMRVRLAFSVAAHLEPEILIVDEVLAVGDVEFQKKCLGKLQDVSGHGRTVLFVSHNMQALMNLCNRAVWLEHGQKVMEGDTNQVVNAYLSRFMEMKSENRWEDISTAPGNDEVRFRSARVVPKDPSSDIISMGTPFDVEFELLSKIEGATVDVTIHILNDTDIIVFGTTTGSTANEKGEIQGAGVIKAICHVPGNLMNSGKYRIRVFVVKNRGNLVYKEETIMSFEVVDRGEQRSGWHKKLAGTVRPLLPWDMETQSVPADQLF